MPISLAELPQNKPAVITGFTETRPKLVQRLREVGFAEGDKVEVYHRSGIFNAAMSINLNRSLIALRQIEAAHVIVRLLS